MMNISTSSINEALESNWQAEHYLAYNLLISPEVRTTLASDADEVVRDEAVKTLAVREVETPGGFEL